MNQLIVLRIVCLAIGYVFGLFQTAYIVGRTRGIDIREHGSGNSGTTNAMRILGKKAGLIVFLGDVLKSLLALLLVGFLFGKTHPEAVYLLKTWTFAGVVHWSFILPGILLFFIPYLITGYVSLGSLILYLGLFIQLVIEGTRGVFDISGPMLTELIVIQGLLTAMAWYRHRANIGRLLSGTERKTHLIKRNSEQLDLDKK